METPVAQQIVQAGNALAVGVGLALVYDGLRAWRRSVGGRHHAADLLFWCVACGGLFLLGMAAGQGQLRLFMALCALAGSGAYFWLVSPVLLPFLCRGLAALRRLGGYLALPGKKVWKRAKKFVKIPKKLFPKREHWVTMKWYLPGRKNQRQQTAQQEVTGDETEESGHPDQTVDCSDGGVRRVQYCQRPDRHC